MAKRKTCRKSFNPKLTKWLNDRDFVSGDWPNNVPPSVKREADREVGGGRLLNECGRPKRKR